MSHTPTRGGDNGPVVVSRSRLALAEQRARQLQELCAVHEQDLAQLCASVGAGSAPQSPTSPKSPWSSNSNSNNNNNGGCVSAWPSRAPPKPGYRMSAPALLLALGEEHEAEQLAAKEMAMELEEQQPTQPRQSSLPSQHEQLGSELQPQMLRDIIQRSANSRSSNLTASEQSMDSDILQHVSNPILPNQSSGSPKNKDPKERSTLAAPLPTLPIVTSPPAPSSPQNFGTCVRSFKGVTPTSPSMSMSSTAEQKQHSRGSSPGAAATNSHTNATTAQTQHSHRASTWTYSAGQNRIPTLPYGTGFSEDVSMPDGTILSSALPGSVEGCQVHPTSARPTPSMLSRQHLSVMSLSEFRPQTSDGFHSMVGSPMSSAPGKSQSAVSELQIESMIRAATTKTDFGECLPQAFFRAATNRTLEGGNICHMDRRIPELVPLWQAQEVSLGNVLLKSTNPRITITSRSEGRSGDILMDENCFRYWILEPTDTRRLVWDILSVIVIMYDMMTLPLSVFDYDDLPAAQWARRATTTFWFFDVILSFFVGHQLADGRVEMRFFRVATNYIRSWFFLDFTVVAIDIVVEIFGNFLSALDLVRIGKTARMVRITRCLRMFRMVRMVKLVHVIEHICDFIFSGPLITVLNILKLLVGLAVLVHFMACGFFAVGEDAVQQSMPSWMSPLLEDGSSKLYMYTISYHWTISQFTPAPNNYHPMNLNERFYAICVLYVGLILFSSLLGSTTALLNMSRQQAYNRLVETDKVRRFMSENRVSLKLGNQIMLSLRQHQGKSARVAEADLPCLKTLPMSLQVDLRFEVYSRCLQSPVFMMLKDYHEAAIVDVCSSAVSEVVYKKGEEPFNFRAPGLSVYFLSQGSLTYYPGMASFFGAQAGGSGSLSKPVLPGSCLSEMSLWLLWEHQGLLTAATSSVVMKVAADPFRLVVQKHASVLRTLRRYVSLYMNRMQCAFDMGDEIDDTYWAFSTAEELEMLLPTTMNPSPQKSSTALSPSASGTGKLHQAAAAQARAIAGHFGFSSSGPSLP